MMSPRGKLTALACTRPKKQQSWVTNLSYKHLVSLHLAQLWICILVPNALAHCCKEAKAVKRFGKAGPVSGQGDQIGWFFSPIGLLLEALNNFLKTWSSPMKLWHFGLLFVEANLFHFKLNEQFQNMVCCRYFKVSKVVWCRCFGFSNELCCRYFGLFWLEDCLGYFLKNWANFWSPWPVCRWQKLAGLIW